MKMTVVARVGVAHNILWSSPHFLSSHEEEKPVPLRGFASSWPLMLLMILMPLKARDHC
jgi:hypothetical protein